jgi:hypothetical protein
MKPSITFLPLGSWKLWDDNVCLKRPWHYVFLTLISKRCGAETTLSIEIRSSTIPQQRTNSIPCSLGLNFVKETPLFVSNGDGGWKKTLSDYFFIYWRKRKMLIRYYFQHSWDTQLTTRVATPFVYKFILSCQLFLITLKTYHHR